ncbi:MAG: diguanylate cyclase [Candidatus Viridilinea halotolerans]|uniref:Diguanylate cyclase n=1 Tax=Candidatus Viridilinea halotolerans TaxID=2491704 RepID=A0A426TQ55_9CHLR|nr:MAG: diguanylate cyclase [Candidatus Viridilinea halotolerans]
MALIIFLFKKMEKAVYERNKTEKTLRIAEERLEKTAYELTENIPVGTYTMVQPADGGMANFAFMSSRFLKLTGLTREEAASDPLKGFACVHPDDFDAWVALNAATFNEKKPFFGETRLVVEGEIRWITAESFPRTLPDGTTVWEGVLADVTDRKRAEEALSESLRRFNDLVAYVSVGVYVFWQRANGEIEFEYVSDSWCAMNQIRREDVLNNAWLAWSIVHPDEIEVFKQLNQQVVRERQPFVWEGRIIVGGEVRFVLIESSPIFFDNGDSRWFGFEQDISERKQAEAILQATNVALEQEIAERKLVEKELKIKTDLLEKISMQDGLTGIPNRRHFDERAQLEWQRARRSGLPLALVMMDVDHFKLYNDHYGHGAGDVCLQQVAQTLVQYAKRPLDLVARYGGEEFVVLLPETTLEGALQLAEQMRLAIERLAIPHDLSSVAEVVTLSVGVAVHGRESTKTNLQHLQKCADQALYQAKHQGRNRVDGAFE